MSMKLYVGNLAFQTSSEDLQQLFAQAGTVEEAVAQARLHQPDIVVMDVRLPDGNGLDLLRELRCSGNPDGTRVIIASASVLPSERDAALAAGADRFLPKPYRPSELVDAVAELLPGADQPEI